MSRRSRPRDDVPGIVRVRLTGDEFDAGFLVRILRGHPEVEIIGAPGHYSGGRVYVNVRVRRDWSLVDDLADAAVGRGESARLAGARLRKLAADDAEAGDTQ
jgi:hypothetical protein